MTIHTCDKTIQCMASCTHGYELGTGSSGTCPSCTCKQPTCTTGCTETHHEVIEIPISTNTLVGGSSGGSSGSSGGALTASGGGARPFSAGGSGGGMTGGGRLSFELLNK